MRRRGFLTGAGAAAAALLLPGAVLAQEVMGTPAPAGWPLRPAPRPPRPGPGEAALTEAAGLGGRVVWAVRDGADGRLLDAEGADEPLPPASTLKAVTALYALDRLGPEHRFTTRVVLDEGRLVLVGGGDPVLDSDGLADLARQVADALRGAPPPTAFTVWGGALPRLAVIDPGQEAHLSYNPAVSGMILNFNRVHLDWRQGKGGAQLRLEARAARVSPRVRSISAAAANRRAPLFDWQQGDAAAGERWTVAAAALRQPGSRWLPVRRPEAYAGDVFRSLAAAEGLILPMPGVAETAPTSGRELARRDSPPLTEILRGMLVHSTNLTAEVVGLAASGAGDLPASGAAMVSWLAARLGSEAAGMRFTDHSGLGAASRVTARGLSALMAGPAAAAGLRALMKTHPLTDPRGRPAQVPVAVTAKTGTLNFVSNLAGFAARTHDPERPLAFAVLCADEARRAASEGQELPAGVANWTTRARHLQSQLIEGWAARWG